MDYLAVCIGGGIEDAGESVSDPNLLINYVWNWIRAHKIVALIVGVGVVFLLCGMLWLAGINVFNKIGSGWYKAKTYFAQKEIDASKQEAADAKAVAEQALKELAEEKQVTAAERAKREIAEKILSDKTLNSNEKLKKYEEAMAKPVANTPVPDDLNALCERAKSLGIECR